ncbi:tachylectin-related carbohydrate-binding protein [Lentzea sp. HUAS12]|uniref:tachylectin-related carbohydrate-binding protein n=1 Tax=Lentzea sp. HUAS12 TaxID=2951806 RepID=UPI00209E036D|nr:tachylectin-related carbohydrate-binding protein [Lentzea sp. HUAS12]USX53865.1 tachylectin-related carbohydrate-binding protein [Lentzea sp. HUAS12]
MMRRLTTIIVTAAVVTAGLLGGGGTAVAEPDVGVQATCLDNGNDLVPSRSEVLRRARSWLARVDTSADPINYYGDFVPYSQSSCHNNSYGSYRQDCSGYLSMVWGMGGRGNAWDTGNLRPAHSGGRTVSITQSQLAPGDALLLHIADSDPNNDHAALFVAWVSGGALVYEQTGAVDRTRAAVWSQSKVNSYSPIRYAKLANDVVSGQLGRLNLVADDGALRWYQHTGWSSGTPSWESSFTAGAGFQNFDKLVAADRTLFGVRTNGDMQWYRYDTDQGFAGASGALIGTGWNSFKFVVSAGAGVVYGVSWTGALHWYRYRGTPGAGGSWAPNSGKVIGSGWHTFRSITASNGVLYAVGHDGSLRWYRYLTPDDGSGAGWAGGSGAGIGSGWVKGTCNYQTVLAAGDGRIYAADQAGVLHWWHHTDPVNGSASWAPVAPCGNTVGSGWL